MLETCAVKPRPESGIDSASSGTLHARATSPHIEHLRSESGLRSRVGAAEAADSSTNFIEIEFQFKNFDAMKCSTRVF